ncbi:ubiquinone biosynthesis protein [Soonwooa buanensis]|uniref:Ubiquinone biosynthesis protein n=1 Tax=Soonwooa buanensis TaxID=619805 RepID=A0A1T5G8D3_9FLAO|nr:AarF/UbiB family protein [Soonwooa buanensis]SKC04645.1 ubiquinone biosynthesis protein [Soonwooa buanensis]
MFDKQQKKIKRSAKLLQVISKYGLQDMLSRISNGSDSDSEKNKAGYERLRLALEELGPSFVKLGQSFSNRDDLLPKDLILELQKLQDRVEVVDMDVKMILQKSLDIVVDEHFNYIDTTPIAAASIAQVYKSQLKNGQDVILKIKRPNIEKTIQADLLLLKDLVNLIDTYSDIGDQINLKNALFAFEKSLLEELSLSNEKNNILRFQKNFKNDKDTYVPKVFEDYCDNQILTMEFVEGTKITDITSLVAQNIDVKILAEKGYQLFVSQILDYGFFHADPHAGNILVNKEGQIVFIDFGAVGAIPESDQSILESLILNFVARKPDKIIRNLKKLAIYYSIPNDRQFENDVLEILNTIHNSSLKDINVAAIMSKMKDVLKENRLVMPDYFYLLFKGISLIDGVGRTINPDLDVVSSLKPYSKKIFFKKLNPEKLAKKGFNKLTDLSDHFEEIPNELRSVLHKLDENQLSLQTEIKNMDRLEVVIKSSIVNLILGIVLAANIIGTSVLWAAKIGPQIGDLHIFPILGFVVSLVMIIVLLLRVLRR